jgi:hypothetical protein
MQTFTTTATHTMTNARHVASKVATDLKRMQRLFGVGIPTDQEIADYQEEAALLLAHGYLEEVSYGLIGTASSKWRYAIKYKAHYGQLSGTGDDPGGLFRDGGDGLGRFLSKHGNYFGSFLVYSQKWTNLPPSEKQAFKRKLPVSRISGTEPGVVRGGAWGSNERRYSSGKINLGRAMIEYN